MIRERRGRGMKKRGARTFVEVFDRWESVRHGGLNACDCGTADVGDWNIALQCVGTVIVNKESKNGRLKAVMVEEWNGNSFDDIS